MLTVYFHKILHKYTDVESHSFEVEDFKSLINGLNHLFPKLKLYANTSNKGELLEFFTLVHNRTNIIKDNHYLKNTIPDDMLEIWLVPTISGSGKIGKLLIGVAAIAVSFLLGPTSIALPFFGTFDLAKILFSVGLNLVLGSFLEENLKAPELGGQTPDAAERRNNDSFDGLTNTISSNKAVNLNYGLVRIAGQFVSGYVETTFTVSSTPDSTTTSTTTPSNTSNPLAIFSPFGVINDDLEDRGGGG